MTFEVSGKKILAGGSFAPLFVQNEVAPETIAFEFNDHSALADMDYKLTFCNADGECADETLTKTTTEDGFTLTWTPSADVTKVAGGLVLNITFYSSTTRVWKTLPFATAVASDVVGVALTSADEEED